MTGKSRIFAIGAIIVVLLGIWGYQMARSLGNFGQLLGGAEMPASTETIRNMPANDAPVDSPQNSESERDASQAGTAATVAGPAEPRDLREEVLEVRREVSRVLVNDPELYASLDELFDETDEDILRENLQILREAFLSDSPDLPDFPDTE